MGVIIGVDTHRIGTLPQDVRQDRTRNPLLHTSLRPDAARLNHAIRHHWAIENKLHWALDVSFGEDQSRIRRGHADANFSILRRTALSLVKNNASKKLGVKNKRLTAAWNEDYLLEILVGS